MKVLIIGAGIGGLTLSALLNKQGEDVTVIEREQSWKNIGYVLGLFPNGIRILEEVGVADALKKKARVIPKHLVVDEEAHIVSEADFMHLTDKNEPMLELEREDLHKVLRDANKQTTIEMGTTVESMDMHDDKTVVTFHDGTTETYDLVVAADGISSRTRNYVQPKSKDYSGLTFWLTWIPSHESFPKDIVYYAGEGKGAALFPCKNSNHIGALFAIKADAKTSIEPDHFQSFLRENFKEMKGVMPTVLERLPSKANAMYHNDDNEMHVHKWYKQRVVLLGDAVHALSPILGMGASMAMEDAHVLADAIKNHQSVDAALENYQRRRRPRLQKLARWSKIIHKMICMTGPMSRIRNFVIKHFFIKQYFKSLRIFLQTAI